MPNRLEAYTIDIVGSIVGIVVFAACSFLELPPIWWFASWWPGFVYFLLPAALGGAVLTLVAAPALVLLLSSRPRGAAGTAAAVVAVLPHRLISRDQRLINVNLIGHQQMQPREAPFPAYALPHLLNRDAGGKPFGQVLIIGAGSGNDVSRAWRGAPSASTPSRSIRSSSGSASAIIPIVRTTIRASSCISTTAATSSSRATSNTT